MQESVRLVAMRAARARLLAVARSVGRLTAVPKYISSGVWPAKAACGICVLCCST